MLKYYNYDIVFQEIPDETTFALNLTNCPNHCAGCHSPHLWEDAGTPVTTEVLEMILRPYEGLITCFCFMGGDREPELVDRFASYLRSRYPMLKIGWYSGRTEISKAIQLKNFDYIKIGPYIAAKGPLSSPTTNQHLFKIHPQGGKEDLTYRFLKKDISKVS